MKRDKTSEQRLRAMIDAMPQDVAKVVRKVCQQRGLLPGGGNGQKSDSLTEKVADPQSGAVDAIRGRKKG